MPSARPEAYIKSQAHEGWRLIPDRYDDGGLSGASLDRPALQTLFSEIRAGKIDIVVVDKVDRLTRSLTDFAKLVELFDNMGSPSSRSPVIQHHLQHGPADAQRPALLCSVRARGDRREGRDKIAASKRKGLWIGGPVPLGYASIDKKLVMVDDEAEAVRTIFTRYLELGSMGALTRSSIARA